MTTEQTARIIERAIYTHAEALRTAGVAIDEAFFRDLKAMLADGCRPGQFAPGVIDRAIDRVRAAWATGMFDPGPAQAAGATA